MDWLPDNKPARLWQQIHKPARLQALLQLPPKPNLDMVLNVLRQREVLTCENGQQVSNPMQFSLKTADSVTIKSVKVSGVDFSLQTDGKQQAIADGMPDQFCTQATNLGAKTRSIESGGAGEWTGYRASGGGFIGNRARSC
jgi:hypothetical protein